MIKTGPLLVTYLGVAWAICFVVGLIAPDGRWTLALFGIGGICAIVRGVMQIANVRSETDLLAERVRLRSPWWRPDTARLRFQGIGWLLMALVPPFIFFTARR